MSEATPLTVVSPASAPDGLDAAAIYRTARRAQHGWEALGVQGRLQRLRPLADVIVRRREEIVSRVVADNGKPEFEVITQEVACVVACLDHLQHSAAETLAARRESNVWFAFRSATVTPRAFGAVLIIAPWNIPLAIPMTQVLSALVAGNAVVLKPSEVTPDIGALLGELLAELELPEGLVQVVQGDGAVGATLVDAGPDKVFFTGSVATGRRVMRAAASAGAPIPVCLELGGVDGLIVCDDADLDFAATAATWGAMMNAGQVCASVERVLVQRDVADRLIQRMHARIERVDPELDLGRITAAKQRAVYDRHIADARERGLRIVTGGHYLGPDRLAPTLICGAGVQDSLVWREESFGPIVAVASFDDDDDAVRQHNDTPFGLTASVFSGSSSRADAIAVRLRAGAVCINDVAATLYARCELPWGGLGSSGFGRSHGREGLLEFTWPQVLDRPAVWGLDFKRPWWFPYDRDGLEGLKSFTSVVASRSVPSRLRHVSTVGRKLVAQLARHPRL